MATSESFLKRVTSKLRSSSGSNTTPLTPQKKLQEYHSLAKVIFPFSHILAEMEMCLGNS